MQSERDETLEFIPQWNEQGLIPVIAQDIDDHQVKMMAWMNEEALKLTLETGFAHYWTRSRQKIWKKGESSGHLQKVIEIRVDCDQDCLLILIKQEGAACHTGRKSCFYRVLKKNETLTFTE